MQRIHPIGRVKLTKGFLATFQRAAVDRVRLALHPRGLRALAEVDPNGKEAQKKALRARQSLLHRIAPARMRDSDSEQLAAHFLVGMESPPRGAAG